MSAEKQSRLQGDQAANTKLLCALVDACHERGRLDFLVSLVPALSKKRSIIKEVPWLAFLVVEKDVSAHLRNRLPAGRGGHEGQASSMCF